MKTKRQCRRRPRSVPSKAKSRARGQKSGGRRVLTRSGAKPEIKLSTKSAPQGRSKGPTSSGSGGRRRQRSTKVAKSKAISKIGNDNTSLSLTASTEYTCYKPTTKQLCWAVTSLKAPFYEPQARANVDIVAVIDKSGSMRGNKIALVRATLLFVIDQLKESDRFSLIVYDANVELVFGLMNMTEKNRAKAKGCVSSIREGSTTNLYGGLVKGMEQIALTSGEEKAQVQSVLLLTDGLANCGLRTTSQIVTEMNLMQTQGIGAVYKNPPAAPSFGHGFNFPPVAFPQNTAAFSSPQLHQHQTLTVQASSRKRPRKQKQTVSPPPTKKPARQHQQVAVPPTTKKAPPSRKRQTTRASTKHKKSVKSSLQQNSTPSSMSQPSSSTGGFLSYLFNWGRQPEPASQPAPQPQPTLQKKKQQSSAVSLAAFPDFNVEKFDSRKFEGTVYTFGFGSDHDADMLEAISTQGGGVYYYIDSNDKIPESFADCLGGLLSVMGQNVSVKLEALGDTTFKKVHTSKDVNWTTPNKKCEVTMGDLQSEESRDIVLELNLPCLPSRGASEQVVLARTEVSYFSVINSQFETVEHQLTTNRTDGKRGPGNMTVDKQRNRVLTADALKEAEELADKNKLKEAQKILKNAITKLEKSLSKDEGLVKLLLSDLNDCLETVSTQTSYTSCGKNYMRSKRQTHGVQRSNFVQAGKGRALQEAFGYGSSSKKAYRMKAKGKF